MGSGASFTSPELRRGIFGTLWRNFAKATAPHPSCLRKRPVFRAVAGARAGAGFALRYHEQQRVSSSPSFDRVDTGRRAGRRAGLRHLVSLGRRDGRPMRAPNGDSVARHRRRQRLQRQRQRDRVRARGRSSQHLGADRSKRRPCSAVRIHATGFRQPFSL